MSAVRAAPAPDLTKPCTETNPNAETDVQLNASIAFFHSCWHSGAEDLRNLRLLQKRFVVYRPTKASSVPKAAPGEFH